jgi:hypothetical protein
MDDQLIEESAGLSRRTLLRRSAVVGGALVWAAPAVQTLAKPAFAAGGSAPCDSTTCVNVIKHNVVIGHLDCGPQPQDRDCPCECFGQPGTVCAEANPCNVQITCVPGPGPCPGP